MGEVDSRPPATTGGGEEATDYSHREQQLSQRQTASPSSSDQDRDRKGSFKTKLTSKLSGFLARVKEEPGREKSSSSTATATPPSKWEAFATIDTLIQSLIWNIKLSSPLERKLFKLCSLVNPVRRVLSDFSLFPRPS